MPPSPAPNRERVDRFAWNRHYFHDPTRLFRWRKQLSILAIAIAGGWLALGYALPEETRQFRYTHGDVAKPHSAWNQRCDSCHASFSMSDLGTDKLLDVHSRWHAFRCETCHHGSEGDPKNYAPHHADAVLTTGSVTDCGICHHDHRGENFSLVKLPDRDCTQCHKDLKEHHAGKDPKYLSEIGRFEAGRGDSHPEFRAVAAGRDIKRTLHFNHALHLTPGVAPKGALENKTNAVWTVGRLPKEFRETFRLPGQGDNDPVTLDCASCHQFDAGSSSNGAYMLPIKYANQCQACHPLDTGEVDWKERQIKVRATNVPHGLTPDQLTGHLKADFVRQIAESKIVPPGPPELKGRDRLDPQIDDQLKQLRSYSDVADELVDRAVKRLAERAPVDAHRQDGTSCGKCHEMTTDNPKSLHVLPPNSPAIWYPHAKFNHASHRALNCASCHPANYQKEERGLPERLDLPGIDNCRQCHTPPHRAKVGDRVEQRGGVRHGCVDCHRYHNGDFSLQRPGSPHRDPPEKNRLDALDFLRGSRPSSNRKSP